MVESLDKEREFDSRAGPATREVKCHNHLLGNRLALDEAWESDGYWFFRDVLDKEAVARLRRIYTEELEKLGVIDPVGDAPTEGSVPYNGADLANLPRHMPPLAARKAWQSFVAQPSIHAAFAAILEDEPFWVPVVEYRATPPLQESGVERLTGIHQDGPNTPGVPFRVCWVPVAQINKQIGGVVLAEGHTQRINRNPVLEDGSHGMARLDEFPEDCWRHVDCGPGDLLLMNAWTPHSGLTNLSDRFRLSFDGRVMGMRDKCPLVGQVVSIAPDRIAVKDANGTTTVKITPDTYVRNTMVEKLQGEAIVTEFPPGSPVIVGHDGGVATVVRPPHSA